MASAAELATAPKTATLALLGLTELSRTSDASTLPYGALAAPAKLPRGALATVKLLVMKEKPSTRQWTLAACGFGDEHVQKLMDALHGSECAIQYLDLSYNPRLTDAGLLQLCEMLGREGLAGHDLSMLRLGGNPSLSDAARKTVGALFGKQRPDLTLDFGDTLQPVPDWSGERDAATYNVNELLQVGKVFPESPASAAGLKKGDSIVRLGSFTFSGTKEGRNRGFKSEAERHMDAIEYFRGVAETLKPLVQEQAAVGGEIDVVVQRGDTFVPLLLAPGTWSGEGLLGAKMGVPEKK